MEDQLVVKAKKGDQEALAELLYNNYEMVYRYLIKFTLNVNLAEDLVQEAMMKAIEKIELFDDQKSKFSTWLVTIAQNTYIDSLRRKKNEQKAALGDVVLRGFQKEFQGYDDAWNRVLDALADLSEEIRLPIILKHYYGYSLEEIAKTMKIPLGTVKSRIHNGLKALKKELDENE
ncbi:MAG: RNA polymerase sigma factor SigY [Clostridia bacterium]|nr:RNA polymerase sigma factor SigY [Clostridia bacterium]